MPFLPLSNRPCWSTCTSQCPVSIHVDPATCCLHWEPYTAHSPKGKGHKAVYLAKCVLPWHKDPLELGHKWMSSYKADDIINKLRKLLTIIHDSLLPVSGSFCPNLFALAMPRVKNEKLAAPEAHEEVSHPPSVCFLEIFPDPLPQLSLIFSFHQLMVPLACSHEDCRQGITCSYPSTQRSLEICVFFCRKSL